MKSEKQVKFEETSSKSASNFENGGKFQKRLKGFLKLSKKTLSTLLYPDKIKCMFCDKEITDFENAPFCDDCKEKLVFNNGKRCSVCDMPLESEATICDFCQDNHRSFKRAFCPFVYEGEIQSAILAFKNDNRRHLATGFAQMIANRIKESGIKIDLITYVPMTKEKQKIRTFNQSELLSEKVAEILSVPVSCLFVKVKDDNEQKTLTYKQRQENAKSMYALKGKPKNLQNVLIVDDVITTCATIDSCAKLLKKKAKNVFVCAIARQYVRPNKPIVINNLPFQVFSCE